MARVIKFLNYTLHRCLLPVEACVGDRLILEHYALALVIHPQVDIGDDCRIYHNVTLAAESCVGSEYKIIIGNRVIVGAHSIVIARSNRTLRIGDDVVIGAGSVVTNDVPAGEVWAGNPARKLRDAGTRTTVS